MSSFPESGQLALCASPALSWVSVVSVLVPAGQTVLPSLLRPNWRLRNPFAVEQGWAVGEGLRQDARRQGTAISRGGPGRC